MVDILRVYVEHRVKKTSSCHLVQVFKGRAWSYSQKSIGIQLFLKVGNHLLDVTIFGVQDLRNGFLYLFFQLINYSKIAAVALINLIEVLDDLCVHLIITNHSLEEHTHRDWRLFWSFKDRLFLIVQLVILEFEGIKHLRTEILLCNISVCFLNQLFKALIVRFQLVYLLLIFGLRFFLAGHVYL